MASSPQTWKRRTVQQVPSEFCEMGEALRQIGERLTEWWSSDGPAWVDGSIAARDAARIDLDDSWGTRPLRDTWLEPVQLAAHTADHIRGMAATILAEGVVASTISLLRPTLEAMAVAYDLMDPGYTSEERLRRALNLRLGSLIEQINLLGVGHEDARTELRISINKIKVAAERHGYEWCRSKRAPAKGLANPVWLSPQPERTQSLLVRLLGDADGDGHAPLLHRLGSAVVHGEPHGRMFFWGRDEVVSLADGMAEVPIRISFGWLATLTAAPVLATDRLMIRACEVYGWPVSDWRAFYMPKLTQWQGWMRSAADGTRRSQ